uniref:F-box associated domain-containing protein n=1 Tax=Tanacetum cinerariifolium TaxID=118510 RepID=A0A699HW57_TANCI|nr:hypothetical protein [Tanacetum cinerariifolium]
MLTSCSLSMVCFCVSVGGTRFDYIYNPSTNMDKMLSEPDYAHDDSKFYGCAGLRLAFDPTKSPDDKVVCAGRNSCEIVIQIYSSKTGSWSLCKERFTYYIGTSEFTIYEMTKGCSVWSIKYIVNTDDFMNPLPEGWSLEHCFRRKGRGLFFGDHLSAKVVQYNLISKTLHEIYDMRYNEVVDDYLHGFILPYVMYDVGYKKLDYKAFEFILSSASV